MSILKKIQSRIPKLHCSTCNDEFSEFCQYFFRDERGFQAHMNSHEKLNQNEISFVSNSCGLCEELFLAIKTHIGTFHMNPDRDLPLNCEACGKKFRDKVELRDHRLRKHPTKLIQCSTNFKFENTAHNSGQKNFTFNESSNDDDDFYWKGGDDSNFEDEDTKPIMDFVTTEMKKSDPPSLTEFIKMEPEDDEEEAEDLNIPIKQEIFDEYDDKLSELNMDEPEIETQPTKSIISKPPEKEKRKRIRSRKNPLYRVSCRLPRIDFETPSMKTDYTFDCQYCDETFKVQQKLDDHKLKCKKFKCKFCEDQFDAEIELNDHISTHPPYFECKKCHKFFNKIELLEIHDLHHKHKVSDQFPCEFCYKKKFKNYRELNKHREEWHGVTTESKVRFCKFCGEVFSSEWVFNWHIENVHENGKIIGRNCQICKRNFRWNSRFRTHMEGHTGPRVCKHCGVELESDLDFIQHNMSHKFISYNNDPDRFRCDHCDFSSVLKQELIIHMKQNHINSGVAYACKICGKGFKSSGSYIYHVATHTGRKTHICDVCGKGFYTNGVLVSHKAAEHYAPVRNFKCEVCDRVFKAKKLLRMHHQVHPETRKLIKCEYCGKIFKHATTLYIHRRREHPEKYAYTCTMCGDFRTQHETALKVHWARYHPNSDPTISSYQDNLNKK